MARLISDILQAREPAFTHEVQRLEKLSGRPKVDIRLISELVQSLQALTQELGLDKRDTTAKELYFAMQRRVLGENDELAAKLGITEKSSIEQVVSACIKHVELQLEKKPVWALKSSVAKSQLKKNPPKKLLKTLGLRSIDSALKREPIAQLAELAQMTESKSWHETYIQQASKLNNTDFDRKTVEISVVDKKRSESMKKAGHALGHLVYRHDETAGVFIVLPYQRFPGDVLFFVDALLRESNEVKRYSAFAKYLSVRADFFNWLVALRRHGLDKTTVQYFNFGWTPVHRMLHKRSLRGSSPPFEPHLDHDDVELIAHSPSKVWQHDHVLKGQDGLIVSCNISDAILNAANNSLPHEASSVYARRALYDELFARYLEHDPVLNDFLSKQP